jgi:cytochrome c553
MIRALIFLGLLAVLPSPGQVGSAALYTEFRSKPAPGVVQAIREEIDFLLAPSGLHLEWRSLQENDLSVWSDLAVVKFSGQCEVTSLPTLLRPDQRLGWTHLSDNVILPFAEVDCDAVFAYIFSGLRLNPQQTREKIFGRAIARVTAHELLHIFARTASHGGHGVDHPSLTSTQLLADRMEFAEEESSAHIVHAGPAPVSPSEPPSALAGEAAYVRAGCASCHGSSAEGTRHGPKLRVLGRVLNSTGLAAKLAKDEEKMCERARHMKLAPPSLDESDISELVRFLNGL